MRSRQRTHQGVSGEAAGVQRHVEKQKQIGELEQKSGRWVGRTGPRDGPRPGLLCFVALSKCDLLSPSSEQPRLAVAAPLRDGCSQALVTETHLQAAFDKAVSLSPCKSLKTHLF